MSAQQYTPTHWMDDRGLVVTDAWLQSDKATSDYRDVYTVPCTKTSSGVRPIHPCSACSATGRHADGDTCNECGGSGGLKG